MAEFVIPHVSVKMRVMNRSHTNHALRFLAIFLLVCAAGVVPPCSLAAQEKHPFGLDDYSALRRAQARAVSPDGKLVLYNVSYDGDKGPTKNEWRLIDVSGENSRKLELPESFHPSGFTKDGQSLFGTYEVDKKNQLGIVPLSGGNPTQIIALPNGIHGTWISPDGDKFAFTADPSPVDPLAEVRHVVENDVTSVYVASVNGSQGAWWCPELKDVSELAWSPDSSQLAVVTQYQKIGHHDVHSFVRVCSSSGARRVAEIPNSVGGLAWADGGKDWLSAAPQRMS